MASVLSQIGATGNLIVNPYTGDNNMRLPKILLTAFSFLAIMVIAACASTPKEGGSGNANDTILSAVEISEANVPTAYEAVDRRRRRWFRDLTGEGEVSVYMDNQRRGGKEYLREIPAQDVSYLEYLKGTDAVMKFGQEARGGAIIIVRK